MQGDTRFDCVTDKWILVTGGTGSLGSAFIRAVLPYAAGVTCFTRDEHQQVMMRRELYPTYGEKIQFILGDVRDRRRVKRACVLQNIVIHAAALKHVHWCEENPFEAVQTNIMGTQNVIEAAEHCGVQKTLMISSDKAVNPINLYGATKLAADRLFLSANKKTANSFSVVRFGNFIGSRGSVVKRFEEFVGDKLPITDSRMTRFFIKLEDAVAFILECLKIMKGGEVFCPKMHSWRIVDLAKVIRPNLEHEIVGIRWGEKLHEEIGEYPQYYSSERTDPIEDIYEYLHRS